MTRITPLEPSAAPTRPLAVVTRATATIVAASAIGLAVYGAFSTAPPSADYDSFGGNLREIALMVYLVGSIGAIIAIHRAHIASTRATRLIVGGYGLVAFGVAAGFVLREDPDWFAAVGIPGNLLAMAGWVTFGVAATRTRRLPTWAATLAAIGGVFAVLFSDFGSGVLIGCFWLYVAHRPQPGDAMTGSSS